MIKLVCFCNFGLGCEKIFNDEACSKLPRLSFNEKQCLSILVYVLCLKCCTPHKLRKNSNVIEDTQQLEATSQEF